MAELSGNLWEWNLARVRIVDVTDDYRLMLGPMPADYYPVLKELWIPKFKLPSRIQSDDLVAGYLYDWHESPPTEGGSWYVGVVRETLSAEEIRDWL